MIGYVTLGTNKMDEAAAFYEALLADIAGRKATAMAMEAVPRISRAQKMDVLSSMACVAAGPGASSPACFNTMRTTVSIASTTASRPLGSSDAVCIRLPVVLARSSRSAQPDPGVALAARHQARSARGEP